MKNTIQDIRRLMQEFRTCHKTLTALGDETRNVPDRSGED